MKVTNKTINLENNTAIVVYVVTVAGGKFVIDGESQATISFRPGVVHRFDLSDSSTATHPFVLSTTSEGSAYTTGRTANGTQGQSGAYIEFTVNAATPDILYYYCSSHSGMVEQLQYLVQLMVMLMFKLTYQQVLEYQ